MSGSTRTTPAAWCWGRCPTVGVAGSGRTQAAASDGGQLVTVSRGGGLGIRGLLGTPRQLLANGRVPDRHLSCADTPGCGSRSRARRTRARPCRRPDRRSTSRSGRSSRRTSEARRTAGTGGARSRCFSCQPRAARTTSTTSWRRPARCASSTRPRLRRRNRSPPAASRPQRGGGLAVSSPRGGAGTVAPRALTRHVHTGQLARYPFDAAWKLAPAKQA